MKRLKEGKEQHFKLKPSFSRLKVWINNKKKLLLLLLYCGYIWSKMLTELGQVGSIQGV